MKKLKAYNTVFVILIGLVLLFVFIASGMAVKNFNKKEMKKRFRTIYANYSNALLKTVSDMGGNTGCYYVSTSDERNDFSNCDEFYKTFVSNLKVQKYCHGKALEDGCIPEYKTYTTKNYCIGFSQEMMTVHDDAFIMNDGSNIVVFNVNAGERRPIFSVDTNGFANPNKAGEDLFSIVIMKNSAGAYYFHPKISYCLPVDKNAIESVNDIDK